MRAMVNIIKYRRPRRLAGVAGCAQISLGCRLPGGWRLEREEDSGGGGEGGGWETGNVSRAREGSRSLSPSSPGAVWTGWERR